MPTLQEKIDLLGKRYSNKADVARAKAAAKRAEYDAIPESNAQYRREVAAELDKLVDDAKACAAVAASAAEGYVLAEPSFMQTGRYYYEDGGISSDVYAEASSQGLLRWPDQSQPGYTPVTG